VRQLVIKVLNVIDARCNREVHYTTLTDQNLSGTLAKLRSRQLRHVYPSFRMQELGPPLDGFS